MPTEKRKETAIFLDTNIILDLLKSNFIEFDSDDQFDYRITAMTLQEVLLNTPEDTAGLNHLIERLYVNEENFKFSIPSKWIEKFKSNRNMVSTNDLISVRQAMSANADIFLTNDKRLIDFFSDLETGIRFLTMGELLSSRGGV